MQILSMICEMFSYIGRVLNRSNHSVNLTNFLKYSLFFFSLKVHSCLKYHLWQYFLYHFWISEFSFMICSTVRSFHPWWIVEELALRRCWWPCACRWPWRFMRVRQRRLSERQGSQLLFQLQGCRRHQSKEQRKTCFRNSTTGVYNGSVTLI